MNKVILMGRLVRDSDVKYTEMNNSQERTCVARYTLAVNRRQPPEGWGIYGWCKETIQRSQGTSYCMKFEDKLGNLKRMIK